MKRILSAVLALAFLFSTSPFAGESKPDWKKDFKKAKKEAAKSGKNLILIITAEQRSQASKNFSEKVLGTKDFAKTTSNFVVVKAELPQDPYNQGAEQRAWLGKLLRDFNITGFPFIVIFDPQGRSIAALRYMDGEAELLDYCIRKAEAISKVRDAIFDVAEIERNPLEKARILGEALGIISQITPLIGYDEVIDRIMDIDKDDQLGLKEKYLAPRVLREIYSLLEQRKTKKATVKIDGFLKEYTNSTELTQIALLYRASVEQIEGRPMAALEYLLVALGLDPESHAAFSIKAAIQIIRAQIETQGDE